MKIQLQLLAPALLLILYSGDANATSHETWICLKNEANERKLILVEDIDNYDWDGFSRPDHNWNGAYVEIGQRKCARAEINYNAGAKFTFIINGTETVHKNRMLHDGHWFVVVNNKSSATLLTGGPNYWIDESYPGLLLYKGRNCYLGDDCYEFSINDVP
jgi:hypothetical protein